MKSTTRFKEVVKNYLDNRAQEDELFATTYQKEHKNIDDCIKYILNTVHKSGCNGLTDEEVYSMAVHYYDEDDIEIGKNIDCRVVVNHTVELTEEEKEQLRKDAIREYKDNIITSLRPKNQYKKVEQSIEQTTLF